MMVHIGINIGRCATPGEIDPVDAQSADVVILKHPTQLPYHTSVPTSADVSCSRDKVACNIGAGVNRCVFL